MERLTEYVQGLLSGPGHLRFLIQPCIAILLGLRDGRLDARAGVEPYLSELARGGGHRGATLKKGLKQITVPLVVAIVVDSLIQLVIYGTVRPLAAVLVGTILIALPYGSARGIGNRVFRRTLGRPRPPAPEAPATRPTVPT